MAEGGEGVSSVRPEETVEFTGTRKAYWVSSISKARVPSYKTFETIKFIIIIIILFLKWHITMQNTVDPHLAATLLLWSPHICYCFPSRPQSPSYLINPVILATLLIRTDFYDPMVAEVTAGLLVHPNTTRAYFQGGICLDCDKPLPAWDLTIFIL